ncbi:MAG: Na+ dependent nucleoside transporter N-terminal domain-containing protein, partial [Sediminibacterium sp.]
MEKFQGLVGIVVIIMIAYLFSNNKSKINYRLVMSGLLLQFMIGVLILKIPAVTYFFQMIGKGMGKIEQFARAGASFVYSGIAATTPSGVADFANGGFVFAFNVTATIILVCVLVALFYHFGIMQRIVAIVAKAMNFIMRVSGAEALSNVASAFVGQVD